MRDYLPAILLSVSRGLWELWASDGKGFSRTCPATPELPSGSVSVLAFHQNQGLESHVQSAVVSPLIDKCEWLSEPSPVGPDMPRNNTIWLL